jgi:hypothetical protein
MISLFSGLFGGALAADEIELAAATTRRRDQQADPIKQSRTPSYASETASESEIESESSESEISLPEREEEEEESFATQYKVPVSRVKVEEQKSKSANRGYSYFDIFDDNKTKRTISSLLRGEDASEDESEQDPTVLRLKNMKRSPTDGLPLAPSMVEESAFLEKFRQENYSTVPLPHPPSLIY